jgi:transcriptional regulator with PAS, ATPase and Fis domain
MDQGARGALERETDVKGGPGSQDSVSDFALTLMVGDSPIQSWPILGSAASRTYVGSSEACAIRLNDSRVSRRHAALSGTPLGLKVEDLESTKGTWVNGIRVLGAVLRGGEQITLGDTTLRVDPVSGPKPAFAPAIVRFGRVLGASLAMRRIHPICERVAQSDVSVLIEGETGCGKEVLAEALHAKSARAAGPFIIFDCTTIAPNLLETTLFGHEKGAFTGAVGARPGVFELASGGTLFIDEIGDLDVALQAKLLRALQSSQVQRVGSTQWIPTNVRIISATRRDLEKQIQLGQFRDDLYFRLVVARIELPPLRERRDDVPLLARSFWTALGGDDAQFPSSMLAGLDDYPWPGNIRELHNMVARRLALGDLSTPRAPRTMTVPPAMPSDDFIGQVIDERQPFARARERVVFEFERRYLEHALAEHGGNVTKAAEACGIGRRYFYVIRSRSAP